jgi:NAD(P)-dependent dehydrogenase (short-subunit alcohol dehydrogenase family)
MLGCSSVHATRRLSSRSLGAVAEDQRLQRVLCRSGRRSAHDRAGQGKIINIASVQSELASPGIAPYTATKGAVKNLTRGMCADWAKHGIQVNAIAPGYFKTPSEPGARRQR